MMITEVKHVKVVRGGFDAYPSKHVQLVLVEDPTVIPI